MTQKCDGFLVLYGNKEDIASQFATNDQQATQNRFTEHSRRWLTVQLVYTVQYHQLQTFARLTFEGDQEVLLATSSILVPQLFQRSQDRRWLKLSVATLG